MGDDRPKLVDRLAHLTPQDRERESVAVVLCELVDELVEAAREQSTLLRSVMHRFTTANAGLNRAAVQKGGGAVPSGPEGDDKGGADVLLREPGLPPEDPNPEPGGRADRPVAEPPAETKTSTRRGAGKATTAKAAAPAKTAATSRSTGKE